MPHLVEVLLPLYDNQRRPFAAELYDRVRTELTERYGGLTAYSRAPAQGSWDTGSHIKQDDIVLLEVMTDTLDRGWWETFRRQLERSFHQREIVIRSHVYELL